MKKILVCMLLAFVFCLSIDMFSANAKADMKVNTIEISVNGRAKLAAPKKMRNVKWKSSNTKIVKVSKKGVIKGNKPGKAKITMKSGKVHKTIKVVVRKNSENKVQELITTQAPLPEAMGTPVPSQTPVSTPEPIRRSYYYVCDIVDDSIYLSDNISYCYLTALSKAAWEEKQVPVTIINSITHKEEPATWNSIEIGDYIEIKSHGIMLYSFGFTNIDGVVIRQRHPWIKTKKFTYIVTEKNGNEFKYQDEYGYIYSQNWEDIMGADKMKFYVGDKEVSYDDLKVGDEICLWLDNGRYSHPRYPTVQKVEIIR